MNKINYDRMCMAVIRQQTAAGRVPTLLLHSCCAPCSSATLEWLSQYFQITVFYYNPNIAPEGEFQKRLAEQRAADRAPAGSAPGAADRRGLRTGGLCGCCQGV